MQTFKSKLPMQECTKCGGEKPVNALDALGICKGGCGGQVVPAANRGLASATEDPIVWLTKLMRQIIAVQPEFARRMPPDNQNAEIGLKEYCIHASRAIYETLSGLQLNGKISSGVEESQRKEIQRLHEQIAKLETLHKEDDKTFEELLPKAGEAAGLQKEVDLLRTRLEQLQSGIRAKESENETLRDQVNQLKGDVKIWTERATARPSVDAEESRKTAQRLAEILNLLGKQSRDLISKYKLGVINAETSNKEVIERLLKTLDEMVKSRDAEIKGMNKFSEHLDSELKQVREEAKGYVSGQHLDVSEKLSDSRYVAATLLAMLHNMQDAQFKAYDAQKKLETDGTADDRLIRAEAENNVLREMLDRLLPARVAETPVKVEQVQYQSNPFKVQSNPDRYKCKQCPADVAKSTWFSHNGLCSSCRETDEQVPTHKPGTKSHSKLCVKCKSRTAKRSDNKCIQCHQKDKGGAKQQCGPKCKKCKIEKPGRWFGKNGVCLKCEGKL